MENSFEAVLYPDGRLALAQGKLPHHPIRVQVTFLEKVGEEDLSQMNDYLAQLTDYEDRLARGEIRWQ